MNKIAIIAAMAAGGSLFAQTISYGVGGQKLVSVNPGIFNGGFSASYSVGTLTVSGSGTYYASVVSPSPGTPPASAPVVTVQISGPISFSGTTTSNYNPNDALTDDGVNYDILAAYQFGKSDSQSFAIPSGLFTVSLKDGATTIASGTFTVVPEPETYAAAAALGLMGFGLWSRRSKKA